MQDLSLYKDITRGDMPGDSIQIDTGHVSKAKLIYPLLRRDLDKILAENKKVVVAVCGGSGVGKSEIGSLLAHFLNEDKIKTYLMSGDNYPQRIPAENDAKRLEVYEAGGRPALEAYLGSPEEIDFAKVNSIIAAFKRGEEQIELKRMGRTPDEIYFETLSFSATRVLIIEWTHSCSDYLEGVDIPILLNSTPEETLAHRRARKRDEGTDSPFTMLVLEIEQEQLKRQAHKAKIIVSKQGRLLSYEEL